MRGWRRRGLATAMTRSSASRSRLRSRVTAWARGASTTLSALGSTAGSGTSACGCGAGSAGARTSARAMASDMLPVWRRRRALGAALPARVGALTGAADGRLGALGAGAGVAATATARRVFRRGRGAVAGARGPGATALRAAPSDRTSPLSVCDGRSAELGRFSAPPSAVAWVRRARASAACHSRSSSSTTGAGGCWLSTELLRHSAFVP